MEKLFEQFNCGRLVTPEIQRSFDSLDWCKHPTFDGVELKHIITADDTDGAFSYHLVKIAPNKKIGDHVHELQIETHEVISGDGVCVNEGKEITYHCGVISIMKAGKPHEVIAGENGLFLFAKFIPALQ